MGNKEVDEGGAALPAAATSMFGNLVPVIEPPPTKKKVWACILVFLVFLRFFSVKPCIPICIPCSPLYYYLFSKGAKHKPKGNKEVDEGGAAVPATANSMFLRLFGNLVSVIAPPQK